MKTSHTAKSRSLEKNDEGLFSTTVDFTHIGSLAFSKPNSLSYFGEEKQELSWKRLYMDACQFLLDDYPSIFSNLRKGEVTAPEGELSAFCPKTVWTMEMTRTLSSSGWKKTITWQRESATAMYLLIEVWNGLQRNMALPRKSYTQIILVKPSPQWTLCLRTQSSFSITTNNIIDFDLQSRSCLRY